MVSFFGIRKVFGERFETKFFLVKWCLSLYLAPTSVDDQYRNRQKTRFIPYKLEV